MTWETATCLNGVFGTLTALSAGLLGWQWFLGRRFPLHRRVTDRSFAPAVTLMKPLKGADIETEACLESWFTQDYAGPVQILFGVARADDPVRAVVARLKARFPNVDAEVISCHELLGANAKVSSLIHLERAATHAHLVVSDADVWAPPDLLTNVLAPLADPGTGLSNCFYRLANPSTPAMRWEAVAVNADFWSQVLQAAALRPLDFALGAVMALRRADLARVGGFNKLRHHLADDYHLGRNLAEGGQAIRLCPVVVECRESRKNWRQVWSHQLRWSRTIRVCRPGPFFCSILSNASLWPALWLATTLPWGWGLPQAGAMLALGWRIVAAVTLHRRLSPETATWRDDWVVPVRDLLGAGLWAAAFLGNRVDWRGQRYRVGRDGGLTPIPEAVSGRRSEKDRLTGGEEKKPEPGSSAAPGDGETKSYEAGVVSDF